jgi:hypothetical protein
MFLALNPQHVFMLALETPDKRNVCISLIRKVRRLVHPLSVSPPDGHTCIWHRMRAVQSHVPRLVPQMAGKAGYTLEGPREHT